MRQLTSWLFLVVGLLACEDDNAFRDKGIVLLSPTVEELKELDLEIGDSLNLEFIYQGSEPLLLLHISCNGTYTYQVSSQEYSQSTFFFGDAIYPVSNNKVIRWHYKMDEGWRDSADGNFISKYLGILAVTENHQLNYKYPLQ